jgi:hypothetical protein
MSPETVLTGGAAGAARYTAEEDAAIRAGLAAGRSYRAIAVGMGRSRSGVMARAEWLAAQELASARRQGGGAHRPWTERERDVLRARWGAEPPAALAAELGRTERACREEAQALRIGRCGNLTTLSDVAALFGVPRITVLRWERRGWLCTERSAVGQGQAPARHVPAAALRAFAEEYTWAYDPAAMRPGHWLTEVAAAAHERQGWLTLDQAAAVAHYSRRAVWGWIRKRGLPAQRLGEARNAQPWRWLVRRADVEAFAAQHAQAAPARLAEAMRQSWARRRAAAALAAD